MPSRTLRWLRAYCGALTLAFFAFGMTFVFVEKFSNFLSWVLPVIAAALVLVYAPRVLYLWALRFDALEGKFHRDLAEELKARQESGDDEDDDDPKFPFAGHDGRELKDKY